jgi:multicomponent Na+:H+ antiporter subunit E
LLFAPAAGIFRRDFTGGIWGRMIRHIVLFAALFVLWLLLSGHYSPLLLAFGVVSSAVVVAIVHRLHVDDEEGIPLHVLPFIWRLWPWLTGEVVKANLEVMRQIVSPRLDISPQLFHFAPSQKTTAGLVTHANSITLTAGTVTLEIEEDGRFLVHALTRELAEGTAARVEGERIEGEIGQRITALGG